MLDRVSILSAALSLALAGAPAFAEQAAPIAVVDGVPITRAEYDKGLAEARRQITVDFGTDFDSAEGKALEKDMSGRVVDQLIERQVIFNEATRRNLKVTDDQVEARIAELRASFPTESAFQQGLKANRMTLDELKMRMRDGLIVSGVKEAVVGTVVLTDQELRAHYTQNLASYTTPEQIRASHILLSDEKKAKDILAKLEAGGDFAALAKEHSEDADTKTQGGDLGYFSEGHLVFALEKVAFGLKPGQFSSPVKTKSGYHLVKVFDRRPPRIQPFAEVKAAIEASLTEKHTNKIFDAWLAERRRQAKVTYGAGFAPEAIAPSPGRK
jgi:foldase protein PrsA